MTTAWHREGFSPEGYRLSMAAPRSYLDDPTDPSRQHARVGLEFKDGVWERLHADLIRLADLGVDLGELTNLGVIAEKLLTEFEADREMSKEQHLASVTRIDEAIRARMEGFHLIGAKLSDTSFGSIRDNAKTIHAARTNHRAECGRDISAASAEFRFEGFTVEHFREWGHVPYSYKLRRWNPEALTICVRCTKVVAELPEGWGEAVKAEELARQAERVAEAHRFNARMTPPHDMPRKGYTDR